MHTYKYNVRCVKSILRFFSKKITHTVQYQTKTVPNQNLCPITIMIDRSIDKNSNKFYIKINDFLIKFSNF